MKRIMALALCIALIFCLSACAGGNGGEQTERLPRAFGVIRGQTSLEKHGRKGESTAFAESDFENVFGSGFTYITVTQLPEADEGMLVFGGSGVIKGQTIPASKISGLRFVPCEGSCGGSFGCTGDAEGWQAGALICRITLTETDNSAPTANDAAISTVAGIGVSSLLQISDHDGDEITLRVVSYPKNGNIEISEDGRVFYTPEEGFTGHDRLVYTASDKYGAESAGAVLSIDVAENTSGVVFSDMEGDEAHLAAHYLCENAIMTYRSEDGKYVFEPDAGVSRIEMLVMTMCASGLENSVNAVADSVAADDAGLSSGMKGFLAAAVSKGIVKLENGNFGPNSAVTFGDAAKMAASALSLPLLTSAEGDAVINSLIREGIIASAEDSGKALTRRDCALLLYGVAKYAKANNMG
ncbi:MAG: cadherin-like domain-containing protein [Clostridia bacterium]|nr:cadherin-like domain-containing protein [Clostridia bacterium]